MNRMLLLTLCGGIALAAFTFAVQFVVPADDLASGTAYLIFSFLATLVPLAAMTHPSSRINGKIDIFSPMAVILFTTLLGTGLRAPYLLMEKETAYHLLLGYNLSDAVPHLPWFFLGLCMLVLGFLFPRARFAIERFQIMRSNRVSETRLAIVALAFLAISALAIVSYITVFQIDLSQGLAALSRKRSLALESEGTTVYGAGWQLFVGMFAKYPLILLAILIFLRVIPLRSVWVIFLGTLTLMCLVIPVLGSSRLEIALVFFPIVIALKYFGRLRVTFLVPLLAFLLLMFSVLLDWRNENDRIDAQSTPVAAFLASGNGLDAYRSSLIMELVPENAPHQYGKTYIGLPAIFIPRSVWPEKPRISWGSWVKEKVFRTEAYGKNGWPPGIIAEGYINFGHIGALIIPFLYGMFLRFFYNTFKPLLGRSVFATVFYAVSLMVLGFDTISGNVAKGLGNWLYDAGPLLLMASCVWLTVRPRRLASRPTVARPV
jgi:oligosaccharide repeat unit polymerase